MTVVECMDKSSLLSHLTADEQKYLAEHVRICQYEKNESVHNKGTPCKGIDIVLNGVFHAYALSENGSTTTLFKFEKSAVLGANLLYGSVNVYPLNIYCHSKGTLMFIPIQTIDYLLHNHDFALAFIQIISQNSIGLNQKLTSFSGKTLSERILDYLWGEIKIQNKNPIELSMSKKEWADYLGVQRPSLFRELKKLKEQGVIDVRNRKIGVKENPLE